MMSILSCKNSFILAVIFGILIGVLGCGGSQGADVPVTETQILPIPSTVNIVESPSAMMVGDLMWVNFDENGNAQISFDNVPENSKFRLVLQSSALSGNYTFILGDPEEAVKQLEESTVNFRGGEKTVRLSLGRQMESRPQLRRRSAGKSRF